jgi:class 3 adenylate cyclase
MNIFSKDQSPPDTASAASEPRTRDKAEEPSVEDMLAGSASDGIEPSQNEKERADILNRESFSVRFRDSARAAALAREALKISEAAGYANGVAWASLNTGFAHYLLSENEAALKNALKSLYAFESLGDAQGEGRARLLIGSVHWSLGNYDQALQSAMAGVKHLESMRDAEFAGWAWNVIAGIHQAVGDIDEAVSYFDKALRRFEEAENPVGVARVMNGLALALEAIGSYDEALSYSLQALELHRANANTLGEARALNDMGSVYLRREEFAKAKECHTEALRLRKESGNRSSAITSLLNLGKTLAREAAYAEAENLLAEALSLAVEIGAKPKIYEIHAEFSALYEASGDLARAFEHFKKYHFAREEVLNAETSSRLRHLHTSLATEKAEREAELERQKNRELAAANAEIQRQMEILDEQAAEIEIANAVLEEKNVVITSLHEESERLLLNVLPAPIAKRLRQGERTIADSFPRVTVLFADIVGFTQLSARTSPEELVQILDAIFSDFDALAEKYGVEKIKTIGDCYMVVGGAPTPRPDHAEAVAMMALEMRDAIERFGKVLGKQLSVRIGLHTGAVAAGVIGKKKFAYDLWGDTVNTASRMESHGEAGKIHVSEAAREALKGAFSFDERGEIEIKGKGLMRTWFLTGKMP